MRFFYAVDDDTFLTANGMPTVTDGPGGILTPALVFLT